MVDNSNKLLVINDTAKTFLSLSALPTIAEISKALGAGYSLEKRLENTIKYNKSNEEKEIKLEGKTVQVFITPVHREKESEEQPTVVIGAAVLLHDISLEKSLAQMKDDFTNMVVHDLRAPLAAMKSASELMISSGSLNPEDQKKLLKIIYAQSKNLLSQVSTILDAAKLESGRFTIIKAAGDIKKVIQDTVDIFSIQAKNKKITLEAIFDAVLPTLMFDQQRMTQVVTNLLSNSLKFTPENGKITIHAYGVDSGIAIAVSDTGIGIPKDKQNQLFMKFSQIARPTADKASPNQSASSLGPISAGTGLGLYITKGIIEAHGGTVSVESEVNQGTTITFIIPSTDKSVASMGKKPLLSQTSIGAMSHPTNIPQDNDESYQAQI